MIGLLILKISNKRKEVVSSIKEFIIYDIYVLNLIINSLQKFQVIFLSILEEYPPKTLPMNWQFDKL